VNLASPEAKSAPPAVSVVVPCYNGEAFLEECLRSILQQSFSDLEIVVVDDDSSDSSRDVARSVSNEDDRVRLVVHETNRGIAAARNTGIRTSRGELIGFLDQDDLWLSDKLEKQVRIMRDATEHLGMVFCDVLMVDMEGRRLGMYADEFLPRGLNDMSREQVLRSYFLHNFIPLISTLMRRSSLDAVGHLDESITGGTDDFELCLRLVGSFDVRYLDEALAVHRVHAANYSRDTARLLSDLPRVIESSVNRFPLLVDLVPRRTALLHYRAAKHYRDVRKYATARRELRKAVRADPRWLRPRFVWPIYAAGGAGRALVCIRRLVRDLWRSRLTG